MPPVWRYSVPHCPTRPGRLARFHRIHWWRPPTYAGIQAVPALEAHANHCGRATQRSAALWGVSRFSGSEFPVRLPSHSPGTFCCISLNTTLGQMMQHDGSRCFPGRIAAAPRPTTLPQLTLYPASRLRPGLGLHFHPSIIASIPPNRHQNGQPSCVKTPQSIARLPPAYLFPTPFCSSSPPPARPPHHRFPFAVPSSLMVGQRSIPTTCMDEWLMGSGG